MFGRYELENAPKDVLYGMEVPMDCEECGQQYYIEFDNCPTCKGVGTFNRTIQKYYDPR
jgi:hypothetical protein